MDGALDRGQLQVAAPSESLCDSCFSFCTSSKGVQTNFLCTPFEDVQKLKQLSHNDSASSTLSVRLTTDDSSHFARPVLLSPPPPVPPHRLHISSFVGCGVDGEIIGDPTQTGVRCSV